MRFLVDTGSDVCLIKLKYLKNDTKYNGNEILDLKGITPEVIKTLGTCILNFNINQQAYLFKFHIVKDNFPITQHGIIGHNFLKTYQAQIDFSNSWLTINNFRIPLIGTSQKIKLPARSEVLINARVTNSDVFSNFEGICKSIELKPGIMLANVLTQVRNSFCTVSVINLNEDSVEIDSPEVILEPCENEDSQAKLFQISSNVEEESDVHSLASQIIPNSKSERIKILEALLRTSHLNSEERQSLVSICQEYNDIFYLPGDVLTSTDLITHKIHTTDDVPINVKPYRIPECHKAEVNRQVKEMEEQGIIRTSNSPYNAPLLVVPKKLDASGKIKWRVVVDYRRLNNVTIGDAFPLPNITDILDNLGKSKYFTKIDLAQGFHQIKMNPEDVSKTAFSTSFNHYEFLKLPFGLKNAPSTFQRLMNSVLSGLQDLYAFVYLDDVVIFGDSLGSHNKRLVEVLSRLRKHNLKLNPDKCEFLSKQVSYLGHVITDEGIQPCREKVIAVQNFPNPTNAKQIKSFLGLAGYYRRFIQNFSKISQPLTKLLRKEENFLWTSQQQESFETLKNILTNPPLLQYPDFSKEFVITTDASNYAIGAILSQGKIGEDLPIAYASRTLNRAEINYSTTEKELLAIVWSVRHFRPYLYGTHFKIVSDHKPLTWLFSIKDPGSRLIRWRLKLEEYSYEVIYKAGKKNTNADCLSRYPQILLTQINNRELTYKEFLTYQKEHVTINEKIKESSHDIMKLDKDFALVCFAAKDLIEKDQLETFNEHFDNIVDLKDKDLNDIIFLKTKDTNIFYVFLGDNYYDKINHEDLYNKLLRLKEILIANDISKLALYEIYNKTDNEQLRAQLRYIFKYIDVEILICKREVIIISDETKIKTIMREYHDTPIGGHSGVTRTYKRIKSRFVWKNMKRDIKQYVRNCKSCQINKVSRRKTKVPMEITTTSKSAFEKVFLDIVGPLPMSESGMKYILTCQDDLSKFSEAIPVPNQEAVTVAEALVKHIICKFGTPQYILTDQGTNFMSEVFKSMCKLLKITKLNTTAFHPQSNGSLERSHQTLADYLKHFVRPDQTDWPDWLPFAIFSYNTTPHSATKFMPFEILFGKKPSLPSVLSEQPTFLYTYDDYIEELKMRLQTAAKIARENLLVAKQIYKEHYDKNIIDYKFKVGDKILLSDETTSKGKSKKLTAYWKGPYEITTKDSDTNFTIKIGNKLTRVHSNRLKPFYSNEN